MENSKRNYEKEWDDLTEEIMTQRLLRESQLPPGAKKWKFKFKSKKCMN